MVCQFNPLIFGHFLFIVFSRIKSTNFTNSIWLSTHYKAQLSQEQTRELLLIHFRDTHPLGQVLSFLRSFLGKFWLNNRLTTPSPWGWHSGKSWIRHCTCSKTWILRTFHWILGPTLRHANFFLGENFTKQGDNSRDSVHCTCRWSVWRELAVSFARWSDISQRNIVLDSCWTTDLWTDWA